MDLRWGPEFPTGAGPSAPSPTLALHMGCMLTSPWPHPLCMSVMHKVSSPITKYRMN